MGVGETEAEGEERLDVLLLEPAVADGHAFDVVVDGEVAFVVRAALGVEAVVGGAFGEAGDVRVGQIGCRRRRR